MPTILQKTSLVVVKTQRFFSVTMTAKSIILDKKFKGFPQDYNFKIVEESLPQLKDGEFLAEAEFLSVDPYIRVYMNGVGNTIMSEQVAK